MEKKNWLSNTYYVSTIIVNIAICITLLITVKQYKHNVSAFKTTVEKQDSIQRIALTAEVLSKVYAKEFLETYGKFINKSDDKKSSDFLSVLNTYYIVSVYYNKNLLDKDVLKYGIKAGLKKLVDSKAYKDLNDTCKARIDKMRDSLQ